MFIYFDFQFVKIKIPYAINYINDFFPNEKTSLYMLSRFFFFSNKNKISRNKEIAIINLVYVLIAMKFSLHACFRCIARKIVFYVI